MAKFFACPNAYVMASPRKLYPHSRIDKQAHSGAAFMRFIETIQYSRQHGRVAVSVPNVNPPPKGGHMKVFRNRTSLTYILKLLAFTIRISSSSLAAAYV